MDISVRDDTIAVRVHVSESSEFNFITDLWSANYFQTYFWSREPAHSHLPVPLLRLLERLWVEDIVRWLPILPVALRRYLMAAY